MAVSGCSPRRPVHRGPSVQHHENPAMLGDLRAWFGKWVSGSARPDLGSSWRGAVACSCPAWIVTVRSFGVPRWLSSRWLPRPRPSGRRGPGTPGHWRAKRRPSSWRRGACTGRRDVGEPAHVRQRRALPSALKYSPGQRPPARAGFWVNVNGMWRRHQVEGPQRPLSSSRSSQLLCLGCGSL